MGSIIGMMVIAMAGVVTPPAAMMTPMMVAVAVVVNAVAGATIDASLRNQARVVVAKEVVHESLGKFQVVSANLAYGSVRVGSVLNLVC